MAMPPCWSARQCERGFYVDSRIFETISCGQARQLRYVGRLWLRPCYGQVRGRGGEGCRDVPCFWWRKGSRRSVRRALCGQDDAAGPRRSDRRGLQTRGAGMHQVQRNSPEQDYSVQPLRGTGGRGTGFFGKVISVRSINRFPKLPFACGAFRGTCRRQRFRRVFA